MRGVPLMFVDYVKKLTNVMSKEKSEYLLGEIRKKNIVKVVFLVVDKAIWKSETVFNMMLDDPHFDPYIVVCPYVEGGENEKYTLYHDTQAYFKSKKIPMLSLYEEGKWKNASELNFDIVFYSSPHPLTMNLYYNDIFLNYLSCYIPYGLGVSKYNNYISQYNQLFHAAQWMIFAGSKDELDIYINHSASKGNNVVVTGHPCIENLFNNNCSDNAWVDMGKDKKRIIWAPHHSIDRPDLPYSNFIEIASGMKRLASKYQHDLVWSFKPHPLLKQKLYRHPKWGKDKTNSYYSFWNNRKYTQINLDEYDGLFKFSDAMIHDSSSFLAEYLYVEKPVLYLTSPEKMNEFYTVFGKRALAACKVGKGLKEIEIFILSVIDGKAEITKKHSDFVASYKSQFFNDDTPSSRILRAIKSRL